MSTITGTYDSSVQLLVPALQAAATLVILNKQKGLYDDIASQRIDLIDEAVTNYVDAIDALITTGIFSSAFGTVPTAILYAPVDSRQEIYDYINDGLQNIPAAERHVAAVNRMNERNDIVRMTAFSPEFLHLAHKDSSTIRDLMHGRLPIDEVLNVLTDDAEQAALTGRIGNTDRRTHRSLGLSRLSMQRAARSHMGQMVQRTQLVSPIERQQALQDLLQTPSQRLGLALSQAQLIQQSLQNQANAAAAGDPTDYAKIQAEVQKLTAKLGNEAQRGNLINQFVPNYSALLQPQIQSISEALLGSGDRTGMDASGSAGGVRNTDGVGQGSGRSNGIQNPANFF